MFKSTTPAGRSRPSLPDLDLIAKQNRLVIRKSSKFDPGAFLQTLLSSVVTGHASLNQLAGGLKDLLAGTIVSHSLQQATEQDKTIGKEVICEVRRGDLVLRDMGYFCLGEFSAIEERAAWWLTRLPLTTGVMVANKGSLEKQLKRRRGDILDVEAIVGAEGKTCRLVAMRAAPEVVAARRAERRHKAQQSGKQPCPAGLVRDGWHIMLTNLTKEQAEVT